MIQCITLSGKLLLSIELGSISPNSYLAKTMSTPEISGSIYTGS